MHTIILTAYPYIMLRNYRYKYQDGEYSSFSPFSDVAFIPGRFKYDAKEAHNLGMVNQLRFLKILDFVPDGIPEGVVCVESSCVESSCTGS